VLSLRLLFFATAVLATTAAAFTYPPPPAPLVRARVVEVPDGDTIRVQRGARRALVRLIGVDCPELHESAKLDRDAARSRRSRAAIEAMGARAAAFTRDHLLGKTVDLELGVEQRDRYGRLLAYVWLPGGVLFNGELLRAGYAQPLTIPPNVKYAPLFTDLAREARADGRGLWGKGLESLSRRGHARRPPGRWYHRRW